MTIDQLFASIGDNPTMTLTYFFMIPLTAGIAGWLGKDEGHLAPWKYLYSTLIYGICVPGILAVGYNCIYLAGPKSISDLDIYTQVLPIISMLITLLLISKNVSLDRIPGFDKMSGLVLVISAALLLTWFAGKIRIIVFSHAPFYYIGLFFLGLLIALRFGFSKLLKSDKKDPRQR